MAGLTWQLDELYSAAADPRWQADLDRATGAAADFRHRYRGRIAGVEGSAGLLAGALADYEALQRTALKPYLYAELLFAADSRVDEVKGLLARARERWSALGEETLFFELEVLALPAERFAVLIGAPELAPYRHYLQQLRAHAPYTLSEEVEQAIKRKDLSGKEAFAQLFEEVTSTLPLRFHFPGEEAERATTGDELLALLYHPNGSVREDAFATFLRAHQQQGLVLTSCFNNLLLDHGKEAELRHYPELMTPTFLASETDAAMVEEMMAVTTANYPLAREYFTLKKQLLGLTVLKNCDLYAPLGGDERRYSYAEACALVTSAFDAFSPRLADLAAEFFRPGRIDVLPRPGKAGGAFCQGMIPGLAPRLLLNFTGTLRDLSTLAHEVGHGIHYALAQEQNLFHYHPPLPLAETASVFGEMLLTRHLLDGENDRDFKIGLLCAKIEEIIATTFRQNVLTRFELAAHRARAGGLLSSEELCRLWWEENALLFGDAVEMIEPYRWGWSYIGHFIHSRFYCYSYIFGEIVTLALYRRYRQQGGDFVPHYLDLLAGGGSASPSEQLRPCGVDLADPAFWQEGYDIVAELIAELRALLAAPQGTKAC